MQERSLNYVFTYSSIFSPFFLFSAYSVFASNARSYSDHSDEFITDLYHGFLLRDPEPDGFNGWMNIIPTAGRKGVLDGFRFSVEFGVLVDNLYAGARPSCPIECPECGIDPCEGPNNGHFSKLCPP